MNKSTLDKFSIYGLHNEFDVYLKFVDNTKIIVSENGQGKTTIISLLYGFMKKNRSIDNYNFKSLSIQVNGQDEVFYPKQILKILFSDDLLDAIEYVLSSYDMKLVKDYNEKAETKLTQPYIISLLIFFITYKSNNEKKWREDLYNFINILNFDSLRQDSVHMLVSLMTQMRRSVEENTYYYNKDNLQFSFDDLYSSVSKICSDIYFESSEIWDFNLFNRKIISLRQGVDELSEKEFIYLPTYQLTNLPTYQLTNLPTYQLTVL
ncbi:hypothetical protein [Pectobacterium aroidearum]|uniref:hypothetical protein n=1 Tax=Pectobacterium aroidearum TaxID=1201031 RepID=UPI002113F163|nr:hypothetical protein [Pectobacterium aroidearum]UUE65233.1 hypothetical protein L0Y22_16815 [Pectobacterium aroidearum]